jgi:translation initiation factor 2-alpha kinase 4
VYVAAVSQVDLAVRLCLTGELWRAGIRADLQYDDGRGMDEITLESEDQNTL